MLTRRLIETAAMLMIGDSVLSMVSPRRHMSLWLDGPTWWRRSVKPFVRHAGLTRLLGVGGLVLGLWLAWQQEPRLRLPQGRRPRTLTDRLTAAAR